MENPSSSNSAELLRNRIMALSFNQTKSILCIGTTMGFRLVRIEDCKCTSSRDSTESHHFEGGFSIISSMFSTQLLLLVGSEENKQQVSNILYFWDEYQSQFKAEIRFRSQVKNVLIRRDKIIIILEKITYIYLLNTLKPIASITTIENDLGVGSISQHPEIFVLGTLDVVKGHVRIENFYTGEIKRGHMHDNSIVLLEINFTGTLAASASELGTVIRVFETNTLQVRHELRRGSSTARITSMSFSPNTQFLLATSNKSTVHIWDLNNQSAESYTGLVTRFLPNYFQPTRSYFKMPINIGSTWAYSETVPAGPIGTFISDDQFIIAHLDGNLYYCRITSENAIIEKSLGYLEKGEVYSVENK